MALTDDEMKKATKQLTDQMFASAAELQSKYGISKTDALLSVVADQVAVLIVLETERARAS